jgi:type I restriction enzyme S subunit
MTARLPCLAELPNGWTLCPLKRRAQVIDCKHVTVPFVEHGVPLASIREVHSWAVDLSKAKHTLEEFHAQMIDGGRDPRPGDIIVSRNATVGAAAIVPVGVRFSMGQDVSLVRSSPGIDSRFLNWLFRSDAVATQIKNASVGATFSRINVDAIRELNLPLPPIDTQRAIAAYLGHETARLDELVRAKEGVLALVAEKRRALITRAVTRGLQPKARLRDSGIPWLGMIPEHWEIERSKWLFKERDERSTTGDEEMLTVSHITGVTPRSEKDVNMFEAETNEGYKLCRPGDLVINTLWAWMGAMGVARVPGMVSPAYNVYTPTGRLRPDYVDALVRIPIFAQEAIRFSKGVWSSRLRLYPEGLYEIRLPVPTVEEQRAIVAYIAAETTKLEPLRASAERTIRLLKERRSALISAAVTGRIAIPTVPMPPLESHEN